MRASFVSLLLCSLYISSAIAAIRPEKQSIKSLPATEAYFQHSSAQRVNTDAIIFSTLQAEYPGSEITIVPVQSCNLFSYAAAGFASQSYLAEGESPVSHKWRLYQRPQRRLDGENGTLVDDVKLGVYRYVWQDTPFLIYLVDGRDGSEAYPSVQIQYIIGPRDVADELLAAAGKYNSSLHSEIWVFDQGWWSKDAGLWNAMQKSSWDNVILDQDMKDALIDNVQHFFDSRDQYEHLGVPWKRGMIFHGPPGNGKTISIKATMHTLYNRSEPIPTLYVKTLTSFAGPEYSLGQIFEKARAEAPCYLVFEDLDSLVTDSVRSYFLNQVDGLQVNDGILMVGSTNHLERLDPGIAKRPSRFDRKFFFPDPSFEQRVQYCDYWRKKLEGNKEIEFPEQLTTAIANITSGFSFAYIQEAFVASLLQIAHQGEDRDVNCSEANLLCTEQLFDAGGKKLEDLLLWRVIRKQIKILREELEAESAIEAEVASENVQRSREASQSLGWDSMCRNSDDDLSETSPRSMQRLRSP